MERSEKIVAYGKICRLLHDPEKDSITLDDILSSPAEKTALLIMLKESGLSQRARREYNQIKPTIDFGLKGPITSEEKEIFLKGYAPEHPMAAARKKANLSQAALSEYVGCTQVEIARYEKGTTEPKASRLKKIARILGCSMESLVPD